MIGTKKENVTPQGVRRIIDEMEDVAVDLLLSQPFYGHLIAGLNRKVEVEDGKMSELTAISALTATTVALNINGHMWDSVHARDVRIKRMKHELCHYILMHPWAEVGSNRGLFYASCDISANKFAKDELSLSEDNFKKLFDKYGKTLNSEGYDTIKEGLVDLSKHIHAVAKPEDVIIWRERASKGDMWDSQKKNLEEPVFFLPQTGDGQIDPSEANQVANDVRAQSSAAGKSQDEIDQDVKDALQDLADNPSDPWDKVKEGTSDLGARRIIENALKDAKSRGDVPGEMTAYVDAFLAPPKIDWKRELRKFTSSSGSVFVKSTMSRRSKRYKTFPALKISRKKVIAVCADTSGSVSDEEFKAFWSEVRGMLTDAQVIFIQADAKVDHVKHYTNRLPEQIRIERAGYGGTSFGPALEFVKTRGRDQTEFDRIPQVDACVYLTDGYAPAPDRDSYPMCNTLWITTQKPADQMIREGFRQKVVFLDVD